MATPPPPQPPVHPLSHVETALKQSLEDLHVRTEVHASLQHMLVDVETTHALQTQLQLQLSQQALQHAQTEHRATILEAHADRLERHEYRQELADKLVAELMHTNQVLQDLMEWKQDHMHKVQNYDALLAKLTQTEEELQAAQRVSFGSSGGGVKPRVPETEAKSAEVASTSTATTTTTTTTATNSMDESPSTEAHPPPPQQEQPSQSEESAPEETPESTGTTPEQGTTVVDIPQTLVESTAVAASLSEPDTVDSAMTKVQGTDKVSELDEMTKPSAHLKGPAETGDEEETQKVDSPEEEAVASAAAAAAAAAKPAVVMLEEEDPPPTLLTVDVEVLMDIFGFLDAMDILNTAQINLTMYTKVDNIFGISEDGQTPPAPTPPPAPAPAKKSPPPAAAATAPSAKPAPTNSKHAPTGSASSTDSGGPLGKALFSMFQPKAATSSSPGRDNSKASAAAASQPQKTQPQSQPLNAKVAQSMASKLSDVELAAIISMTDKLSKMEKEVHLLRNDKEVLAAKLDGTEAVKQFLISKVRDVELKLNRSREDEIKVTQQIASDQEVIAFLDSRVQELEQLTDNLTTDKASTQKELETLKVSTSKKITMLSDMLKYEREKLREDEGDWKATKKVLVKEVKSCRAQILALQAERDGFKEQNDVLKRAIMSTGGGSGKTNGSNRTPPRRRKFT